MSSRLSSQKSPRMLLPVELAQLQPCKVTAVEKAWVEVRLEALTVTRSRML